MLTTVQENAVSEDRAHDLRIMRPTRYQLRYHRHVLKPTESPLNDDIRLCESVAKWAGESAGCTMGNGAKRHRDHGTMEMGHWRTGDGRTDQGDNGQVHN
jgi:hypothetical protein